MKLIKASYQQIPKIISIKFYMLPNENLTEENYKKTTETTTLNCNI